MDARPDLPTDPEARARVLALYAMLMAVGGITHDDGAIDAADVLLRNLAPTSHPVEAYARGEAVAFLAAQAEGVQTPKPAKVRRALQPRIFAAQAVLMHTRPAAPDPLADILRRTA